MQRLLVWFGVATVLMFAGHAFALGPDSTVHHEIEVSLEPATHQLQVVDTFSLPLGAVGRENTFRFTLHDGLSPVTRTSGVEIRQISGPTEAEPIASTYELYISEAALRGPVKAVTGSTSHMATVTLAYSGVIFHPLKPPGEEYARGFGETPGIIGEEGIYLSNTSSWIPRFGSELVTFTIDAKVPQGWDTVSQGNRLQHETGTRTRAVWVQGDPQDEVYLIGGPFTEYQKKGGGVDGYAFLRTPDPELAHNYLEATGRYIDMYNELIGQYAYGKFALVENFWETGYGMPSFTLLGPKIIRFPFIINSSYPHEILHNWWGNGVYVDYSTGNWCEGITAYLADHLMKEQEGGGAAYRRETLQKYTDYVNEKNDFPLTQFMERHSAATEAVGYGKSLMFDHMMRVRLGDDLYRAGMAKFYADWKFRKAKFADMTATLSAVSGTDLSHEYTQWVTRTGAPELKIASASASAAGSSGKVRLTLALTQVQPGEVYELLVPVAVHLQGQKQAFQAQLRMSAREQTYALEVPGVPFMVDVDPEFDIFRRLNRYEIPPSLSQGFGAPKTLLIVPSNATADERAAYESLAANWSQSDDGGEYETRADSEITELPDDRAIWVLGWGTKFDSVLKKGLEDYDLSVTADKIRVGTTEYPRDGHSLVVSARNPKNPGKTISWVAASPVAAIPGLDRKLPHYGKYSFLVFDGTEPTNVAKGVWPAVHSPMSVVVTQPDGTTLDGQKGRLAPRKALIEAVGAFSAARLKQSVQFLASEQFKGRELGTPELDQVGTWIAEQFRAAGLQAGGDQGFIQAWQQSLAAPKGMQTLKNVVGFIPGKSPEFAGQSIVIGAHYDHLGLGWPDAHEGNVGMIHPGADDNASGVAVLLELARYYGSKAQDGILPERSLVFVAFTGEEAGLLGSKHFAATGVPGRYEPKNIFAMLNMDTVGRLGSNKLMILGGASARDWPQIIQGVGYVTGVPVQVITAEISSSDQKSFSDVGIPAIQFFSGANGDYHRPSDTADKIDADGMVKVTRVVQETADYLIGRKEALSGTTDPNQGNPNQGTRKVYLGTVPDFAFEGDGVRVDSVQSGSPAEKAGLLAGDIIVQMNSMMIHSLKEYSDYLKTLHGGDSVLIRLLRGDTEKQLTATVIER